MKCCRYSCCPTIATSATKCWVLTDWCCRRWCKTDTSWWQTLCWISTTSLCRWVDNMFRLMLHPSAFLSQPADKYQMTHKLKQVATNFRFRYVRSQRYTDFYLWNNGNCILFCNFKELLLINLFISSEHGRYIFLCKWNSKRNGVDIWTVWYETTTLSWNLVTVRALTRSRSNSSRSIDLDDTGILFFLKFRSNVKLSLHIISFWSCVTRQPRNTNS